MLDGGSLRRGTQLRRIFPGCRLCLISMVLFLGSVAWMHSPYTAGAAAYQCRDAAGKTVLTNRPSHLDNCHVLAEETSSATSPPPAVTTPQVSPPSMNSDLPPAPPYAPSTLPKPQADMRGSARGSSMGSRTVPNPDGELSPSPPQPCLRGLNPLNPLSSPPCDGSSGTNPSGAAPTPSQ